MFVSFVKIGTEKLTLYRGEMNFYAYFSLFVKFRIGGLHVMLIIIREFNENRSRESRTCHTGVNKVILQLCVYRDGRGLRNLKSEEPGL
jgi:hypothetical protein